MKIHTNENTKQHKLNEYLLQLYVFSPDSKNRVPAPNKKTDSTQLLLSFFNNTNKPTMAQTKQLLIKIIKTKIQSSKQSTNVPLRNLVHVPTSPTLHPIK